MKSRYDQSTGENNGRPWDGNSRNPDSAERQLWQAVMEIALSDLSNARKDKSLKSSEIYNFFFSNTRHFEFVCLAAGYDPDFIKMVAKLVLNRGLTLRMGNGYRYTWGKNGANKGRRSDQARNENARDKVDYH